MNPIFRLLGESGIATAVTAAGTDDADTALVAGFTYGSLLVFAKVVIMIVTEIRKARERRKG